MLIASRFRAWFCLLYFHWLGDDIQYHFKCFRCWISCSRSDLAKPSNLVVFPMKLHGCTFQKKQVFHYCSLPDLALFFNIYIALHGISHLYKRAPLLHVRTRFVRVVSYWRPSQRCERSSIFGFRDSLLSRLQQLHSMVYLSRIHSSSGLEIVEAHVHQHVEEECCWQPVGDCISYLVRPHHFTHHTLGNPVDVGVSYSVGSDSPRWKAALMAALSGIRSATVS